MNDSDEARSPRLSRSAYLHIQIKRQRISIYFGNLNPLE